jgi:hypothetical protein
VKRFSSRAFLLPVVSALPALALSAACALGQTPLTLALSSGATGTESLAANGKAPAEAQITLTATALISQDLPVLSLGTQIVRSGSDGTYHAVVDLAPAYQRGARVTVVASADGETASATTIVQAPNPFNPAWDNKQGSR